MIQRLCRWWYSFRNWQE